MPVRHLFAVPPATPSDEAAPIEPASVACHSLRRSRLELGESVAIIGAGPIGLLITGMARATGASRVAVIEPAWNRPNLVLQMGADLAFDSTHEGEAAILEITNAHGADVVFETSGTAPGFDAALWLIRKQGRLVMVALYEGKQVQLDANNAVLEELIATFWANDVDFRRAVDLISARKLDVRPLISACYELDHARKAFEGLRADRESQGKIPVNCS